MLGVEVGQNVGYIPCSCDNGKEILAHHLETLVLAHTQFCGRCRILNTLAFYLSSDIMEGGFHEMKESVEEFPRYGRR